MTHWYLRKRDGIVYGPVPLSDLCHWAADGRVEPGDQVSNDSASWQSAADLPDLEMDYTILLQDDTAYGPVHLLAVQELLIDGSIRGTTWVVREETGEKKPAADWLVPRLVEQGTQLHAKAKALQDQLQALQKESRPPQPEDIGQDLAAGKPSDEALREIDKWRTLYETERTTREQVEKALANKPTDEACQELDKWRSLYETERTTREQVEQTLTSQNKEIQDQLNELQTAKETLTQEVNELQEQLSQSQSQPVEPRSEAPAHAKQEESYEELSKDYARLLDQLHEKTTELNALRVERGDMGKNSDTQVGELKERLKRQETETQQAQTKLAEVEEAHMTLRRSFRELNDRYIQLREQQRDGQPPAPDVVEKSPEDPPTSADSTARSNKPSARKSRPPQTVRGGKPKFKLT